MLLLELSVKAVPIASEPKIQNPLCHNLMYCIVYVQERPVQPTVYDRLSSLGVMNMHTPISLALIDYMMPRLEVSRPLLHKNEERASMHWCMLQ